MLGLQGASDTTIAERIIRRSQWDDLAAGVARLQFYFRPSRDSRLDIVSQEVLEVDCHFPAKQDYLAYRLQRRVRELLHGFEFGGKRLHFDGQLGELPTAKGFVCVGSRYRFYTVF